MDVTAWVNKPYEESKMDKEEYIPSRDDQTNYQQSLKNFYDDPDITDGNKKLITRFLDDAALGRCPVHS